jgi:EmrB/QacA subfamily drug resistance transporter
MKSAIPLRKVMKQKILIAGVFATALSMDLMDTTIVNVALTSIGHSLSVPAIDLQSVITAYVVALAAFMPASGWLGDRFGTKRVFLIALAIFTVSSLLCAVSQSVAMLIGARILQGVGGGLMTPVGLTMMMRAFPEEERATASAVLSVPVAIAPAIGPLLSGFLVEHFSWHWIFAINLPIGFACLLIAWLRLDEHREGNPHRFDGLGLLLSVLGFATLIYALSALAEDLSRGRGIKPLPLVAGSALLVAFVVREVRATSPLLELRLLRDRALSVSSIVMFFAASAFGGTLFLLPLMLQSQLRFSPLDAGWATFGHALGIIIAMTFAGRLYRKSGGRIVLTSGMAITGAATFAIGLNVHSPEIFSFTALMLAAGIGFGLTIVPLQTMPFSGIGEAAFGQASALYNTVRQVALACGVAAMAALLAWRLAGREPFQATQAYQEVFFLAAGLAGIGAAVALLATPRTKPERSEASADADC